MGKRPTTVADVRNMNGPDIAEWLVQMANVYDRMVNAEEFAKRCANSPVGKALRENEDLKLQLSIIKSWVEEQMGILGDTDIAVDALSVLEEIDEFLEEK